MERPFPKEINPSPIISSTVEVRFSSDLTESDFLSYFYPIFNQILPEVKPRPLPPLPGIKNSPEFKYWADFSLSNKEYSLLIGQYVLAFNLNSRYSMWSNYFEFISSCLKKLISSPKIKSIERVAVKYINLFKDEMKIAPILDSKLSFPFNDRGYNFDNEKFSTNIFKGDMVMKLQVAENVELEFNIENNRSKSKGVYFDIEAFQTNNLPNQVSDDLITLIDSLHNEVKTIFFLSLKQDFVQRLLSPKF